MHFFHHSVRVFLCALERQGVFLNPACHAVSGCICHTKKLFPICCCVFFLFRFPSLLHSPVTAIASTIYDDGYNGCLLHPKNKWKEISK